METSHNKLPHYDIQKNFREIFPNFIVKFSLQNFGEIFPNFIHNFIKFSLQISSTIKKILEK